MNPFKTLIKCLWYIFTNLLTIHYNYFNRKLLKQDNESKRHQGKDYVHEKDMETM